MKTNTCRILLILLILLLLSLEINGFTQELNGAIDTAFLKLQARPPLEKLYLHLDKSSYDCGGTIWFKAYLLTATGHLPFAVSKFIYVELFDNRDSLVYRKKIKEQDSVFSGNIKLESDLQEGEYTIRAYSLWMLNSGFDYLFRKAIHIRNFQSPQIQSQIDYKNDADGNTTATISFYSNNGDPIGNTKVKCSIQHSNEKIESFNRTTGVDGKINFVIRKDENKLENPIIEVAIEDKGQTYLDKFNLQQNDKNDFDVQFFPEGGELIGETDNNIAFKAIAQDGFSTSVSGVIINNNNDTICAFKSEHLGFGQLNFVPRQNKRYYAVATNTEGVTRTFTLPQVVVNGVALSVLQEDNLLKLTIRSNSGNLQKPYYILAHSCENKIFSQDIEKLNYNIPTQNLPEGIIHFVLIDENMHPVSSRLVYIKKKNTVNVLLTANKVNYKRREAVSLSVSLEKEDTVSRTGNFSISVTDDQVVNIDSLAGNIRSNLLLTSDIKGYVENPAFYFLNDADSTNYYLDLLLLTQGWQRFSIKNVLQDSIPQAKYFLELGQTISGKYEKGLLQKKQETQITALSIDPVISASTQTNEEGSFIFNQLDFPDSTTFTIQSQRYTNIKQEPAGFITLDKDVFPPLQHALIPPTKQQALDKIFLKNQKERMYFEGEGRMIQLDEFIVTATDKRKNYLTKYGISSSVVDKDKLAEQFRIPQPADVVVRTLPGVFVNGEQVMLSGNNVPAEIIVDGMLTDLYPLSLIQSDEIDDIVIIKGAGAAVYSQSGGMGGVILIHIKKGGGFKYLPKGVLKYTPLGYQKVVEFYVPKYEVDSIRVAKDPDMRSTIYWNSKINLDSLEQTTINFYTADSNTTYTYILEGITNLGEICRVTGKIKRTEK